MENIVEASQEQESDVEVKGDKGEEENFDAIDKCWWDYKGCMTKTIWSTKEQDKDIECEQVKSKDNIKVYITTIVQSKKDFELITLPAIDLVIHI